MPDQPLPREDIEAIVVDAVAFAGSAPEHTAHGVTSRVAASGPLTVKLRHAGWVVLLDIFHDAARVASFVLAGDGMVEIVGFDVVSMPAWRAILNFEACAVTHAAAGRA